MTIGPLFFDIETQAHPRAEEWISGEYAADDLTVAELKAVLEKTKLPTSGTKAELIERATKQSPDFLNEAIVWARALSLEEAISKAPLDPDLGAIRSIGWASGDREIHVGIVENENTPQDFPSTIGDSGLPFFTELYGSEDKLLEAFWHTSRASGNRLVGANILNFDIPYLLRRSMDLGIPPERLNLRRFTTEPICDIMQILAHWGAFKFKPLKWTCKRYGISIPMPETDGSMVATMSEADLLQYTASDIHVTRELWRKMNGVYWLEQRISPQQPLPF